VRLYRVEFSLIATPSGALKLQGSFEIWRRSINMPSMSRGGKRVGAGRRRGMSRQTIARNAIKAVANTLHLKPGKSRPALEVLQDLLDEALAIAAYF